MTSTTTIEPANVNKRRKRIAGNNVEQTVELVQIVADNTPREGQETFSVQLMDASFSGTALTVATNTIDYTIEDASGMCDSNPITLTPLTLIRY